jgi:hypothetical protein
MTSLGLGSSAPSGEVAAAFKGGWVRHFKLGLSSAGGAAIVLAIFELLEKQPGEGFKLLAQWGPWPVIALVSIVIVGSFLSKMNDTISTTFGAVVTSVQQQAEATGKTADALTRLADQGGKQAQEIQRLAIFATEEFPGIYRRFDRQDAALELQSRSLQELTQALRVLMPRGKDGE